MKQLPSFGGALSKFAFDAQNDVSLSTRVLRPRPSPAASPVKRAASASTRKAPSSRTSSSSTPRSPSSPSSSSASSTKRSTPASPLSGSSGPTKKRKRHAGYAPPSTYSHLSPIPDILAPNLLLLFVGTNPGIRTAQEGHAYASPSNLFWKLLHESGLTPDRRLAPSEDLKLPELYSYGNTNLVSRPTRDQAELSREEMEASTPLLEAKIRKWRPESCVIVGKGIWESIWRHKTGRKLEKSEFSFGWQDMRLGAVREGDVVDGVKQQQPWEGARTFVAISTSGLVAGYSKSEKLALFRELADWIDERRKARGETAPRGLPDDVVEEAARRREVEWRELRERNRSGVVKVEDELEAGEAGVKALKEEASVKDEAPVKEEAPIKEEASIKDEVPIKREKETSIEQGNPPPDVKQEGN